MVSQLVETTSVLHTAPWGVFMQCRVAFPANPPRISAQGQGAEATDPTSVFGQM